MNLVIDIGNTRSKLAVFKSDVLVDFKIAENINELFLHQIIFDHPSIERCIISSVTEINDEIANYIVDQKIQVVVLNAETSVPFKNNYLSKDTLGCDRIAAIAGACKLYPGKNVLIIDTGTAVTFDLKDQNEEYLGGNISPGLEMRFKALHHFTAKLPLLNSEPSNSLIGKSTHEAIINGVQNGLVFEIEGYIDELQEKFPDLIVILTGGDVYFFENKLKKTIFVVSNLILTGLNTILEYNVQTN
jgi:type III pantothenate kinase